MEGEGWTIDSRERLLGFLRHVQQLFDEHKFITVGRVRASSRRSRGQEALWGIWCREIADFQGLSDEAVRLAMYHMFLGYEDLRVSDKLTVKGQLRRFPTDAGEAYDFMSRVQSWWFQHGLVLQSKGEFANNQRREVA